jgi:hypothetical protein
MMKASAMKFKWILAMGLVVMAGCGSPRPNRSPLQGKVTYEGNPVVYGLVIFNPDTEKGNKGVFGTAEINDGVYQTNPDYGPTLGAMRVNVQVYDSKPPANHMLVNIPDLAADIPSGTSTWDFQLTAKDVKPIKQ